jgi:predicted phage baseplate assembly protein
MRVEWEVLEDQGYDRYGWKALMGKGAESYALNRTGTLEFPLQALPEIPEDGFWIRGRFVSQTNEVLRAPDLPPVTHLMLNTVNAVNLHVVRNERYSGHGIPSQKVSLLRAPLFLHEPEAERPLFPRPDLFDDIRVFVESEDGVRLQWRAVHESEMLMAGKDDKVFVVDPVDASLTFGNGIRGKMLPAGSNNLLIERYARVPGGRGNVGPESIVVCDQVSTLDVTNLLPANGGRDAEAVEEIIRRAPSLLTTRDRAVTRMDFEVIAKEASSEVARAACLGRMEEDGQVGVVILPHRREGERIPDAFLAAGLRDHVSNYLTRRSLINVQPVVRLAKFLPVDLSIFLRLRPKSNIIQVREAAERWIVKFLDPYHGGLDGEGWPFGGTLYSQDFARMVSDLTEVRHVVSVDLYSQDGRAKQSPPSWEEGIGEAEIGLQNHDLFVLRRIRVLVEEEYR